jgi:formylglycine-generating enzyme required for sulfatase activity
MQRAGAAEERLCWAPLPSTTQIVKTTLIQLLKKANAFGLYDMLGSVLEWVLDSYGADAKKRILHPRRFVLQPCA